MKERFFGEFGESVTFSSSEECTPHAPQVVWRPATFKEWRQQDAEERHIVGLFLRGRFSYDMASVKPPLTVTRLAGQDQPDFSVVEDGLRYGLEISQATTQRFKIAIHQFMKARAEKRSLHLVPGPELNIEHDRHPWDSGECLRAKCEPHENEVQIGCEPELQWADICVHTICKKLVKLRDHYSKTHSLCDLLLYSNTHTPLVDLAAAVQFLKARARACPQIAEGSVSFRSVTVVAENWVVFDALGERVKIATREGWPFGELPS